MVLLQGLSTLRARMRIVLSATLSATLSSENPAELWTQLLFVVPPIFSSGFLETFQEWFQTKSSVEAFQELNKASYFRVSGLGLRDSSFILKPRVEAKT